MNNSSLILKNLSKEYISKYKKIIIFKNLNINIKSGDFISLVGPSGSGKSTLLHLIAMLDKPTSGDIFLEGNIFDSLELYNGLDGLYSMFSNEAYLLVFWLHFLAISLFAGSWISRDSQKFLIHKFFVVVSLILTYFTGPVGLIFYWLIRIFYSKKINFND